MSSEPEPHQVVINQQDPGGVGYAYKSSWKDSHKHTDECGRPIPLITCFQGVGTLYLMPAEAGLFFFFALQRWYATFSSVALYKTAASRIPGKPQAKAFGDRELGLNWNLPRLHLSHIFYYNYRGGKLAGPVIRVFLCFQSSGTARSAGPAERPFPVESKCTIQMCW